MYRSSYQDVLTFLKEFGGEKYKELSKRKNDEEREYMEKGAEKGKNARANFTKLVEIIAS